MLTELQRISLVHCEVKSAGNMTTGCTIDRTWSLGAFTAGLEALNQMGESIDHANVDIIRSCSLLLPSIDSSNDSPQIVHLITECYSDSIRLRTLREPVHNIHSLGHHLSNRVLDINK